MRFLICILLSEIHQHHFETIVDAIKGKVEKESSISINVSYSYQNKSTDTIAVDSLNIRLEIKGRTGV
jgi:hypothetical protein